MGYRGSRVRSTADILVPVFLNASQQILLRTTEIDFAGRGVWYSTCHSSGRSECFFGSAETHAYVHRPQRNHCVMLGSPARSEARWSEGLVSIAGI